MRQHALGRSRFGSCELGCHWCSLWLGVYANLGGGLPKDRDKLWTETWPACGSFLLVYQEEEEEGGGGEEEEEEEEGNGAG